VYQRTVIVDTPFRVVQQTAPALSFGKIAKTQKIYKTKKVARMVHASDTQGVRERAKSKK
jgi:hypothetical protein